ncbi:FecR family protein [Sphingobacterium yanglingense]|uniref:FecR family protein n=1 Tax=Sphingobacterium yanglingense TaxID=1437280 RepID=A0A4R6WCC0_9SPHI|nr:FecR domain-containing protein [Sphingobacterium yanglingense]TDQ75394.1 FecR family protein [Sphingobacterium yanglingense]
MMMRWLSNKPSNNKKDEIWRGIINKAQQDGDHSLDNIIEVRTVPIYKNRWVAAVAMFAVILSTSIWIYRGMGGQEFLAEKDLKEVFADAGSVSRLVLSNGDTIFLDATKGLDSNIAYLADENYALDFRKLDDEELLEEQQIVETARGKQLHIILSDGTGVWLNASSKIVFPARFQGDKREVAIDGEAYFEVAHNKKSPFIVKTEGQQVKVLGTHFNIRQYKEEGTKAVTLLEGAVQVTGAAENNRPIILKPSEQLVQLDRKTRPTVQTLSNPEAVIAWKDGEFYFEDAGAEAIVKELERWYPVSIGIKQQDTSKKISGRIKRTDSMKEVVDMLRFFDIEVQVEKN